VNKKNRKILTAKEFILARSALNRAEWPINSANLPAWDLGKARLVLMGYN